MKKTLAVVAVAATMMTAAIQAKANEFPLGPILGGVAGGFIGNQFGRGRGNTIATAMGAVGGLLLGQQLQRPSAPTYGGYQGYAPEPRYRRYHRSHVVTTSCDAYRNPGARAACNRGVADRNRAYQRAVERQAYSIGRGRHSLYDMQRDAAVYGRTRF